MYQDRFSSGLSVSIYLLATLSFYSGWLHLGSEAYVVRFTMVGCSGTKDLDLVGDNDLYVVVAFPRGGGSATTPTVDQDNSPTWNWARDFSISGFSGQISMTIEDSDTGDDDRLGTLYYDGSSLEALVYRTPQTFIVPAPNPDGGTKGTCTYKLEARDYGQLCTNANNCNGHASSVSGTLTTGCSCTCRTSSVQSWTGATCNTCASGYSGYPNGAYPLCYRQCSIVQDCSSHATSVLGQLGIGCTCSCLENYAGTSCNICAKGYARYHKDCVTTSVSASLVTPSTTPTATWSWSSSVQSKSHSPFSSSLSTSSSHTTLTGRGFSYSSTLSNSQSFASISEESHTHTTRTEHGGFTDSLSHSFSPLTSSASQSAASPSESYYTSTFSRPSKTGPSASATASISLCQLRRRQHEPPLPWGDEKEPFNSTSQLFSNLSLSSGNAAFYWTADRTETGGNSTFSVVTLDVGEPLSSSDQQTPPPADSEWNYNLTMVFGLDLPFRIIRGITTTITLNNGTELDSNTIESSVDFSVVISDENSTTISVEKEGRQYQQRLSNGGYVGPTEEWWAAKVFLQPISEELFFQGGAITIAFDFQELPCEHLYFDRSQFSLGPNITLLFPEPLLTARKRTRAEEIVAVTSVVAATTAGISSSMGSVSGSLHQARIGTLIDLSACNFSHEERLSGLTSLTGLKFGQPHAQYYRGAVVGNFIMFFSLFVIFFLVALGLTLRRRMINPRRRSTFSLEFWDACATIHFPSVLLVPTGIGFQGTVSVCLSLFIHSDEPLDILLAVLGGLSCTIVLICFTLPCTYWDVPIPFADWHGFPLILEDRTGNKEKSLRSVQKSDKAGLLVDCKEMLDRIMTGDQHWIDPRPETKWKRKYMFLIFDYKVRWFLSFELGLSGFLGLLDGLRISNRALCTTQAVVLALSFFTMLGLCFFLSPGFARFQQSYINLLYGLSAVGALTAAYAVVQGDPATVGQIPIWISALVNIVGILKFVLDLWFAILWCHQKGASFKSIAGDVQETFFPTSGVALGDMNTEAEMMNEPLLVVSTDADILLPEHEEEEGEEMEERATNGSVGGGGVLSFSRTRSHDSLLELYPPPVLAPEDDPADSSIPVPPAATREFEEYEPPSTELHPTTSPAVCDSLLHDLLRSPDDTHVHNTLIFGNSMSPRPAAFLLPDAPTSASSNSSSTSETSSLARETLGDLSIFDSDGNTPVLARLFSTPPPPPAAAPLSLSKNDSDLHLLSRRRAPPLLIPSTTSPAAATSNNKDAAAEEENVPSSLPVDDVSNPLRKYHPCGKTSNENVNSSIIEEGQKEITRQRGLSPSSTSSPAASLPPLPEDFRTPANNASPFPPILGEEGCQQQEKPSPVSSTPVAVLPPLPEDFSALVSSVSPQPILGKEKNERQQQKPSAGSTSPLDDTAEADTYRKSLL